MTSAVEVGADECDAAEATIRIPSTVSEDFGPQEWRAAVLSTVGVIEDD
jgi:hypothetical protein